MGLFKDGVEGAIKGVGDILDNMTTTKEEKAKAILDQFEAEMKDRDSAREVYKVDSDMQKKIIRELLWGFYAFLICYLAMLFYPMIFPEAPQIPDVANSFISMIFGFFTAKIGTIVDFFFGGSKSNESALADRRGKK